MVVEALFERIAHRNVETFQYLSNLLQTLLARRSRVKGRFGVVGPHYYPGLPHTSRTRLNHMSDKKSKKSAKYPRQQISLGIIPAGIAVGPLGFRTELAEAGAKSEQSRSYHDLRANDPDPWWH